MQHPIPQKARRRSPLNTLLRILFFLVIIALLVGGGFLWYWKTHKKQIIREGFEKAILEKSDSVYSVKFADLQMNEVAGQLTLKDLQFSFDSSRFRNKKWEDPPPMLVSMHMDELNILGVKSLKDLKKNKLKGKVMYLKNPVIDIYYTYQGKKAKSNIPTKEEIYDEMMGGMDINLDSLIISGARIRTKSFETGKVLVDIQNVSVTLEDLQINELARFDTSRLFFSKQFSMHAGTIDWLAKNNMYKYSIENTTVRSRDHRLMVGRFAVKPLMGESEFVHALKYQDDRYDFSFSDIQVADMDVEALLDENLKGETMRIGNASFKIYRDLNMPPDNKSRIGHYPHQIMNKTPFKFTIRKVVLAPSLLQYREKEITGGITVVTFNNMQGVFSNFTNNEASVKRNNIMIADLNAGFSGLAPMKTRWTFYLMDPDGRFSVSGNLAGFPGTELNKLLGPNSPARIEEGQVNDLQFNLAGNNTGANGTVTMYYNGLKVAVMEKDKGKKKMDKKFLTSLFANIMIKNDNPKKNEPVRVAMVNEPRDPHKTLFNLCWKALFQGIKASVGIKK